MGDHNNGLALGQQSKRRLYPGLVVRVGKGGGLVKDQHRRVFQHRPGNGDALLLSAGEIHTLAADHRMDAAGEFFNNIHALGGF